MIAFLYKKPCWYHYALLCTLAFLVRATTFYFFVQPGEYYHQPDSNDYHYSALCMRHGYGMSHPSGQPMFWRTPGYPWLLSHVYTQQYRNASTDFSSYHATHARALWWQILICSLLPLLAFWLAYTLTQTAAIAWLVALISIFHLGFVLASTFLLTDGLAMIVFTLFLVVWYRSFRVNHETTFSGKARIINHPLLWVATAALVLGAYTWLRPMGQFIALLATCIVLFGAGTWKQVISKACLFFAIFLATISPWIWRNHQLTGSWFFCPLFGLYFNAFNAPKILARVEHIPLEEAHKKLSMAAHEHIMNEHKKKQEQRDRYTLCQENECMKTAWPVIAAHPWYFIYDWIIEACKTTFDLYASQLVAIAGNCFAWDPLVEYLGEKIQKCLYAQPMSWSMRLIAWTEFICAILLWIGIFCGLWVFVIRKLWARSALFFSYGILWLKTGILIGATAMQTGGFGYARLRLPVELLMIILAVTFWWWFFHNRSQKSA